MKSPRKVKAPVITETQEHRTIADYFRKTGLGGCAVAFHIKNDQATKWQRLNAKQMGTLPGVPDWCFVDGGRVGFIELKTRGWKAGKSRTHNYEPHEQRQIEAHNMLKRAGAWVEICETLEEVLQVLAWHGVPLRQTDIVTEAIRSLPAMIAALQNDTIDDMIDEDSSL